MHFVEAVVHLTRALATRPELAGVTLALVLPKVGRTHVARLAEADEVLVCCRRCGALVPLDDGGARCGACD